MPIHDIVNYSTSIYPFVSGKCGNEGKKLQTFECLENEKSFLDEIRNTFHSFWRAFIWWKKIDKKIADASFKLEIMTNVGKSHLYKHSQNKNACGSSFGRHIEWLDEWYTMFLKEIYIYIYI